MEENKFSHGLEKKLRNESRRLVFWVFFASIFLGLYGSLLLIRPSTVVKTATPPPIINYQGKLLRDGASVTTAQNMGFLLFDASTNGNLLYTAAGTLAATTTLSITPTSGVFSVDLGTGSTNAIPTSTFANNHTLYLEVQVGGAVLSPRKRITAVPYAINSEYLSGLSATTTSGTEYIPRANEFGNFLFTGTPRGSTVGDGLVYLNPTSSIDNYTLFGIAAGGTQLFRLDEDGDAFLTGQLFASSSLTIDNGSLFVNASNNRVGVGSTTPYGILSVSTTAGVPAFVIGSSTATSLIVDASGRLGLNTTAPEAALHIVNGGLLSTASSTITGGLNVSGAINASSTLLSTGLATLYGGFQSNGSSSIGSILSITGATTVSSTLAILNLSTLTGGFLSTASSTVTGILNVQGSLSASSTIIFSNLASCDTIDTSATGALSCGTDNSIPRTWEIANGRLAPTTTILVELNNGFVSAASSSIASSLNVSGNLNASSTLFVNGAITNPAAVTTTISSQTFANALVISDFSRRVGIGTSTPFATLSVSTTAGVPSFVIGSSTATHLIVDSNGRLGLGKTNPTTTIDVAGDLQVTQAIRDAQGWLANQVTVGKNTIGKNSGGFGSSFNPGVTFTSHTSWSTYDPGANGIGVDPDGYNGVVFDGRYIYFVPYNNGTVYHGEFLRYDTTQSFNGTAAWTAYDPSANGVGTDPDGYAGGVFDGRYIYFSPYYNGTDYHGEVLRYDTRNDFTAVASWITYDPGANGVGSDPDGFQSAVFDGRYVYFVPFFNNDIGAAGYDGEVLRYDTSLAFTAAASWAAYDPGANGVGSDPDGYIGAIFDGRYIYFSPYYNGTEAHGEVLRYDTTLIFNAAASWSTYDAGANGIGTDPDGYKGVVFDGRYIYFAPFDNDGVTEHGEVLRYDTTVNFSAASAWSTYDAGANGVGTDPDGYQGAVFDGRYIYFVPYNNGTSAHGEVLRYDTARAFNASASWSTYDAGANGIGTDPDGYQGAVFDGRYVYFAPDNNGTAAHGEILRLDTGSPDPQYGIGQVARSRDLFLDSIGRLGANSTSPWGQFSVSGTLGYPSFVISSSTPTAINTTFVVDRFGRVGIGTTTPFATLSLSTEANRSAFVIGSSTATYLIVDANGRLGLGTTAPEALLHLSGGGLIVSASSSLASSLNVSGNLNASSSFFAAGLASLQTGFISTGSSTISGNLNASGDITSSGTIRALNYLSVNSTSPQYGLSVSGTAWIVGTTTIDHDFIVKGKTRTPRHVATMSNVGNQRLDGARGLKVRGHYAYVLGGTSDALNIFDISDPYTPRLVGSTTTNQNLDDVFDIEISDSYAYIAGGSANYISVFDVSNPANITFVTSTRNVQYVRSIKVQGNYLYAAEYSADRLSIFNISDPTQLRLVGRLTDATLLDSVTSLFVSGRYAYLSTANGLEDYLTIIDVSDPTRPVIAGSFDLGNSVAISVFYLFVQGKYAYLPENGANQFRILDISNPANIIQQARVADGGSGGAELTTATGVVVSGDYAYITDYTGGALEIMDISSSTNPLHVGKIHNGEGGVSLNGAEAIEVQGRYAYITAETSDVFQIIDVGGANISNADIGTAKISNLQVLNYGIFDNGVSIKNGLTVGNNGLFLGGDFAMSVPSSSAYLINATNTLSFSHKALFRASSTNAENFIFDTWNTLTANGTNQVLSIRNNGTQLFNVFSGGGFLATGSSTINSSLNVSGNLNASSTLFVNGAITNPAAVTTTISSPTFPNALVISDFSRRVGIGTSTPFATLSVSTTAGVPAFVIGSSTATHLIVNSSGQVGIGTASPDRALVVIGTIRTAGNISDSGGVLDLSGGSGNNFIQYTGTDISNGDLNIGLGGVSNRLRIKAVSGITGLGTSAPDATFEINSSTGAALRLTYNDSDGAATNFGELSIASDGDLLIRTAGTDADMTLRTPAFQNALFIDDSARRVGIGTSTPFATLSVSTTAGVPSFVIGSSTATYLIVDSNGKLGLNSTTPWGRLSVSSTADGQPGLVVASSTVTSFIIDAYGNVGINTSSPKADLQIEDIITLQQTALDVGGALNLSRNIYQTLDGSSSGAYQRLVADNDTGMLHINANGDFLFYGNSDTNNTPDSSITLSEQLRVTNDGQFGFGTSSPWGKFAIHAAATTTPHFVIGSSTKTHFIVNNNGSVGIGTDAPSGVGGVEIVNLTGGSGAGNAANYLQITGATANNNNYPSMKLKGGTLVDDYPALEMSNGGLELYINSGQHSVNYNNYMRIGLGAAASAATSFINFSREGSELARLQGDGSLGIASTTTGYDLAVGNSGMNSGDTAFTNTSHSSFKENIAVKDYPADLLDSFGAVRVRTYNYTDEHLFNALGITPTSSKYAKWKETRTGLLADEFNPLIGGTAADTTISGDDKMNVMWEAIRQVIGRVKEIQAADLGSDLQGDLAGSLNADHLVVRDATFTGQIIVRGHATFGGDSVGQARIKAGENEVRVKFAKPYQYQPVVTVTPRGNASDVEFRYAVKDESTTGFTIRVQPALATDIEFNWHAFGVDRGRIYVSDGTSEDIRIVAGGGTLEHLSTGAQEHSGTGLAETVTNTTSTPSVEAAVPTEAPPAETTPLSPVESTPEINAPLPPPEAGPPVAEAAQSSPPEPPPSESAGSALSTNG